MKQVDNRSLLQRYYLHQMGIETWELKTGLSQEMPLQNLSYEVKRCTHCTLHKTRTNTVFARGCEVSGLMIIGEAPGFNEDRQGVPFVGKAGHLLNKMLKSIGLDPELVYIANVLKCRPPENRDPHEKEIEACSGYLARQISLVNPKLLFAVGRFAGQFLLNKSCSMNAMRGKTHRYGNTPVLVSYHPAYLLRNPREKKKAYADFLQIRSFLHD